MRRWVPFLLIASLWPGFPASAGDEDALAVIVAPQQAGRISGLADLALVYRRKRLLWEDGTRMQPANLPPEHPLRRNFSQRVLGASPKSLAQYWSTMYFHGISPPHVFGSEEAVLRFVAETPGALGYVSACEVDARVKAVLWIMPDGEVLNQAPMLRCGDGQP